MCTFPVPAASHSSAIDVTSCLLQPSFPPGQPPSVVFATPPPPQMNPTPQPRQVGLPTAHLLHSTPKIMNFAPFQKRILFLNVSKQLFSVEWLTSVVHYKSKTCLIRNTHFCQMRINTWDSVCHSLFLPVSKFGITAAELLFLSEIFTIKNRVYKLPNKCVNFLECLHVCLPASHQFCIIFNFQCQPVLHTLPHKVLQLSLQHAHSDLNYTIDTHLLFSLMLLSDENKYKCCSNCICCSFMRS